MTFWNLINPGYGPIALNKGGGGWSPVMLASDAWWDPSDLSTMFQNSDGTTPVTADGDPVGYIADKSGNGRHATQPTASLKPLYKTSGGLHWLQFDGIDDQMVFTVPDGGVSSMAMAAQIRGAASGYKTGLVIQKQIIYANLGGTGKWGGFNGAAEISSSYALTTKSVVIQVSRSFNDVDLYTNANAKENKTNGTAYNVRAGSIGGASAQYGDINFYGGLVALREFTAPEITDLKAYLAAKSGVTL